MLFPWVIQKKERRIKFNKRTDLISEQVRNLLQKEDQKLILMVRG